MFIQTLHRLRGLRLRRRQHNGASAKASTVAVLRASQPEPLLKRQSCRLWSFFG